MVHLENLIGGVSCIEAARGEYSAYRLVVYIIIIVAYFSSCARVNVFFRISSGFVFIRARTYFCGYSRFWAILPF